MSSIEIQQALTVLLPFVAALVSYAIQQEHFSSQINTAIAIATVLLASIATIFFQGKLTGDVYGDVLLVLATATALQAKELAPLQNYLKANFPVKSSPDTTPQVPTPAPANTPGKSGSGI